MQLIFSGTSSVHNRIGFIKEVENGPLTIRQRMINIFSSKPPKELRVFKSILDLCVSAHISYRSYPQIDWETRPPPIA